MWWQELIDGYASNAATISTNRRAVLSPRSIPIAVLPRRSRSGRPSGRLSETGYRGSRGQGDQRRTVEAGVVEPVQQMNRAGPRGTDRKFADSPLEGTGFELPVPRDSVRAEPISSQAASMHRYMTVRRTRGSMSQTRKHKPLLRLMPTQAIAAIAATAINAAISAYSIAVKPERSLMRFCK